MGITTIPDTTRRGFLKGLGLALGGAALVGADLLIQPKAAEAAGPGIPWSCMSQAQRNAWLVQTARGYTNRYMTYPDQCKGFVRAMVKEASSYGGDMPVTVPSTSADGWHWDYNIRTPRLNINIRQAVAGNVIQMLWRRKDTGSITPHTAIVSYISTSYFYVIDDNWPRWPGDHDWVQEHYWFFTEFDAGITINGTSCYSIYQIQ